MSQTRITVVIAHDNMSEHLRNTLRELYAHPRMWHEVLIADTGASDGLAALLAKEFPRAVMVSASGSDATRAVTPCTPALNEAFKVAQGDWILCLEADSHPFMETFGIVAGLLDEASEAAAVTLDVRRPGAPAPLRPHRAGDRPALCQDYAFNAAGVLLNRRAVASIGGFDPDFSMHLRGQEWAARACHRGYYLLHCAESLVVQRRIGPALRRRREAYLASRDALLFILRYAPRASRRQLLTEFFSDAAACSFLHRTPVYARALCSAFATGLSLRSKQGSLPLDAAQFTAINPDLTAPFAFLA